MRHPATIAKRESQMTDTPTDAEAAAQLRAMAAAVGVDLTDERAVALVPQAEPHFALLRALDAVVEASTEPAAEFRLDGWVRGDDN
jgi:hypothetical protein